VEQTHRVFGGQRERLSEEINLGGGLGPMSRSLALWITWLLVVNYFVLMAARAEARRSKMNWLSISMGLGWLKGKTPEGVRYRTYAIVTLIVGAAVCFLVDSMLWSRS